MTYTAADYFTEHEADGVRGFTIIETGADRYHIAERWQREGQSDTWLDYWIEADALTDRIEGGACEPDGSLSTEQFEAVCENTSWELAELN
jgi:hypothetical protein